MAQLITEFWMYLLGAFLIGAVTLWLFTRLGWSRRLHDNEEGWRRRVRAVEESWISKMNQARDGFDSELVEREGHMNALKTDLASERGRVTATQDDLDEASRALAGLESEKERTLEKVSQLDERLAGALERSDRFEIDLRSSKAALHKAQRENVELLAQRDGLAADRDRLEVELAARAEEMSARRTEHEKLTSRLTGLQGSVSDLERTLGTREARIAELEPLQAQVLEAQAGLQVQAAENQAERAQIDEEMQRLRVRVGEMQGLEQQLRDRFAEIESLRAQVARMEPLATELDAARTESGQLLAQVERLDGLAEQRRREKDAMQGRVKELTGQVSDSRPPNRRSARCPVRSPTSGAAAMELRARNAELLILRARVHELEKRPKPGPDDLKRIKGIGPTLERLLHSLGVRTYAEIAGWDEAAVARMDARLEEFKGRIAREGWVDQARSLQFAKFGQES